MSELEALVHVALGQASMCWSETPKGIFQDQEVAKIGEILLAAIKAHEEQEINKARAVWHLSHPHIIRDSEGKVLAQARNL